MKKTKTYKKAVARAKHLQAVIAQVSILIEELDNYSCELIDEFDGRYECEKFWNWTQAACDDLAVAREAAETLLQVENRIINECKAVLADD